MNDILNVSTLEENLNYVSDSSNKTVLYLYRKFMSSSTLDEMYYTNMLPSINSDDINLMMQFTNEQILSLSEKANVLYASITNPTADDKTTLEDLIDTLNLLENGGNAEIIPLLESGTYTWDGGTQAAQTISGNVVINVSGTITIAGKITVAQNAVVTIQGDCTFVRSASYTSNLFDVYDDGTLNIKGTSESSRIVIDCKNIESDTVIRNDQNLNMENVTIKNNNNTLAYRGKVTDEEAGTTDETDTSSNSQDTKAAGAITIIQSATGSSTSSTGSTVLKNCIIENCKSKEGGGLYLVRNGGGTVDLINTTIKNCSSTSNKGGGGIFIDGKPKTGEVLANPANYTVNIINSTIDGCTGANGSAIFMHYKGVAKINIIGSRIQNNASSGSGSYGTIRSDGNSNYQLTIDNCIIQNNISSGAGGGVYWNAAGENSVLRIKGDTKIINNTAKTNGGGLFVEGALMEIQDTIISGNEAQLGAGICVKTFADSGFKGQGLWTANDSFNLYLYENTIISNNIASQKGGGLAFYIVDAVDIVEDGYTFNFVNDGAVFSNNSVTSDGVNIDGVGGAIAMIKATSTNNYNVNTSIKSGSLINNHAYDGGAVHITIGNLQMSGGEIKDHSIDGCGGAVYIDGGNFTITNGSVTDNSAVDGGAVYITNGNFSMVGGILNNNKANANGGAAYVADGNVDIKSGNITNNIALNEGGAIAATNGNVTIGIQECYNAGESSTHTHPVIENNIASDGGGIYVDGGITTMWCGDIKHNLTYEKTVNVLVVSGGNFIYHGGSIGIPYDSGVFVNGGVFDDNSEEAIKKIKHELYYHAVLDNIIYNNKIPESKWIASPRGNILSLEDSDNTAPTWGDLFSEYEFVGWEDDISTNTDKIANLYAIWEKK